MKHRTDKYVDEGALFVTRALAYERSATAAQRAEAARWYDAARCLCSMRAQACGVTLVESARVMAILSPRARWNVNTEAHAAILEAYHAHSTVPPDAVSVFRGSVVRAWGFLHGREWDSLYDDAPKVYAFAPAILGDTNEVVVDTIVARALAGKPVGVKAARYQRMAAAIRVAADTCGMTPRELQALIWIVERGGSA